MNTLTFSIFAAIELLFLIFIFAVARSGWRNALHKSFIYFMGAFAVWAAMNFTSNMAFLNADLLLLLNQGLFATSAIGLLALAHFTATITKKKLFPERYVLAGTAVASILSMTPLVVRGITIESSSTVGVDFGPLAMVYFILILFLTFIAITQLLLGMRKGDKYTRAYARTFFYTVGIAVLLLVVTNVVMPVLFDDFHAATVGQLVGIFVIGGAAYAIVRHGMFDIRLAVIRSIAYSMSILVLLIIALMFVYIISTILGNKLFTEDQLFASTLTALFLAVVFQPIKQFFDKYTNKVFYRYNYSTDEFYSRLNQKLSSASDLHVMLEEASAEIGRTMQAEQSFFFVWYGNHNHVTAGSQHHSRFLLADIEALDQYTLDAGDSTIVTAMLPNDHRLYRIFTKHKVAVTLPLLTNGSVLGYAFLGERRSGSYTHNDLRVLETVADTLLIAVQNALSVEEVKELNATLQQRINDATKELRASNAQLQKLDEAKDEFVSMASHQLRTPLTSVKGYISMVLEGDAGKISDAQRHLLSEAFTSSERMVHLINDFLNVSRLQTGKFMVDRRAIDLAKITGQEVDSLKTTASARNLKLKYRKPSYFPTLYIDEGKIRQVIMNFIDNAIYYSSEFSTITIGLEVVAGEAILTVHNEGIGVPESEKAHLFTKFFRAANARKQRPDGTGVGLFLSKMVVTAHGGKMVFASEPNEGTTFGFRLPVKKLSTPPVEMTD